MVAGRVSILNNTNQFDARFHAVLRVPGIPPKRPVFSKLDASPSNISTFRGTEG